MPISRYSWKDIPDEYRELSCWPTASLEQIDAKYQDLYQTRFKAIELYVQSKNGKEIEDKTGLSHSEVIRLFKKCIKVHSDGRIYGYRGLVPYLHQVPYNRKKEVESHREGHSGLSGVFEKLLKTYPVLDDLIQENVFKLKKSQKLHESKISITKLHDKFLRKCRELDLETSFLYPFNTENLAYVSLSTYIKSLITNDYTKAFSSVLGKDADKKNRVGDGSNRPIFLPFERVECDAHEINGIFCILIPSTFGELIPKVVHRIWLIAIEDVATRCVIGYYVSLGKECSSNDILKAVKHALTPWQQLELIIPVTYHEGASLPSGLSNEFSQVCWKEFSVDGAMANLAHNVSFKMESLMGCKPTVLNRRISDDRPFVERFFGTIGESFFNRLPNTTGTSPSDIRRDNPELIACKYFFELEELEQLMDIVIANYNGSPHSSIGGRTPLSYLQYLTKKHQISYKYASELKVKNLMTDSRLVTVKGSQKEGVCPYINFTYARYTSLVLKSNYSLVGKKIRIEFDSGDIRILKAFHSNGTELGVLKAAPPWHLVPHSVLVRQTIMKLKKQRKLHFVNNPDPVLEYLEYCEKKIRAGYKLTSAYLEARKMITQYAGELERNRAEYRNPSSIKTKILPKHPMTRH